MSDTQAAPKHALPQRLGSMDAFRGFVMLLMASGGLALASAASAFPDCPVWQAAAFHTSHVEWRGCSLWDLIQPSFMFLVGTSMAFSYAARADRGQSYGQMLVHAAVRAIVLILLGVFLRSNGRSQINWTFEDVLTQIGLGYFFLFLLWRRNWGVQLLAAAAILVGYWALFYFYPLPPEGFDYSQVGVSQEWLAEYGFTGVEAHWNKNVNPAHAFDVWFLNLFPRESVFLYNGGGYQTLSFIPSLATMIFGLLVGEWLKTDNSRFTKLCGLLVIGGLLVAIGVVLDGSGVAPLVKRIWTPTWAVWSAGVATLLLAAFYLVVDVLGWRSLVFFLVVVGMNSIVMYVMSYLCKGWFAQTLQTLFGPHLFDNIAMLLGPLAGSGGADALTATVRSAAVLGCMWLVVWWLYRQRIFVRI